MATITNCPACQRQLRVPEHLFGELVRCPTCGETFTAIATAEEAEPAVEPSRQGFEPHPSSEHDAERESYEPSRRAAPRRPAYDDEYDDYEDDRPTRGRRRYAAHLEPHRGSTILTLGILSLVICGPILGPIAWVMGNADLKAIRSGRMDPSGEGLVSAGRICGMIGTIISAVLVTFYCLMFAALGAGGARFH